jgi:hypothetical protein
LRGHALLRLGSSEDLEGRLRTKFDLIERNSQVSSKRLEKDLYQLRTDLTGSLGPSAIYFKVSASKLLTNRADLLGAAARRKVCPDFKETFCARDNSSASFL